MAAVLSEPQVLARAKRRLFPDHDEAGTYAVTDAQFATDRWSAGEPIPADVRETLAPFNRVAVGSGYPDLVGVRSLEADLLAVERFGDEPPLIAVEAKGYAGGDVDVERGIVQAHDRLGEANAAFVAAPSAAIDRPARTLARELNVGVLGVDATAAADGAGAVEPLETPRVVGNRTSTGAGWIRFQATAQGVADRSFGLNHPKNYLAYPLAVRHERETEAVLAERVVDATADARRGAAFLDLIREGPRGAELAPLGREVVRFARREYGSTSAASDAASAAIDTALDAFADWHGSPRRFCDLAPRWGQLARRVVWAYPATQLLVEELETMREDGLAEPSLVEVVTYLHELHPSFTVELFVRGTDDARRRVLTADGDLRREALSDGAVYHSPTVFQLKAMLYHAGFLTERGAEPSELDPTADAWALREPVGRG